MGLVATGWANLSSHGVEAAAEGLALASVVLIWLPARRMLKQRKGHTIARQVTSRTGKTAERARYQEGKFLAAFQTWSPLDTRQIWWGLVLAIVSSVIKIGLMMHGAK